MKKSIIALIVLFLMLSAGCGRAETADLVIVNGRVLTADSRVPDAEAVAIRGNVILAVGSQRKISRHIDPSTTRVIDAGGRQLAQVLLPERFHGRHSRLGHGDDV